MKLPPPRRLRGLDAGWCLAANRACSGGLARPLFAAISRLGDGVFWYALIAALMLLGGSRGLQAGIHLCGTGIASLLLYRGLKQHTRRPRPCAADRRIELWVAPLDEFSFPSGHTLHAVAFTLVTLAYFPLLAWLLIPFTAGVAASRVALGLHYPSDVAAATVLGGVLAAVSIWLVPGVSLTR
ncbi:MAG TPA: phosphatase PAP2 family protein [Xanthomonadaceae bacterium]|nr:phosphatase PAP2 family protein [Xanthomonadaceae bacterium]